MARSEKTITLPCPAVAGCEDALEDCGADVTLSLEWTPGEMYGSDADGNRGIWQSGYWSVYDVSCCTDGHTLDAADEERLVQRAEEEASEDERDGYDYSGPDTVAEARGDV